jgi:pimeloyl-ACP methyl ester carboxylesterase
MPEIELSQGSVCYRDHGSGACVLLIHGLFVNGSVWDRLVPLLSGMRSVISDLPLGAHRTPVNGADLSPPGLAPMIAEFTRGLALRDLTVVGNNSGGALVSDPVRQPS